MTPSIQRFTEKRRQFIMKIILAAITAVVVISEAFAAEQCPAGIRLADLKKIAATQKYSDSFENQQEYGTFEMKGETWTITYLSGNMASVIEQESPIGDKLADSRIIIHKDKDILHCEYRIFTVRQNDRHNNINQQKAMFFIERVIKDDISLMRKIESSKSSKNYRSSAHYR